jgi:hypothetical protein
VFGGVLAGVLETLEAPRIASSASAASASPAASGFASDHARMALAYSASYAYAAAAACGLALRDAGSAYPYGENEDVGARGGVSHRPTLSG